MRFKLVGKFGFGILALCAILSAHAKEIFVGPGMQYTTIGPAIYAQFPLTEDLKVYVIMPTRSYNASETISLPSSQANGHKIVVQGTTESPSFTVYVDDYAVFEGSGNLSLAYENISGPNGQEGRIVSGKPKYMIKDHLGSTRTTLDEVGATIDRTMYYSYGKMNKMVSSASETREKFTSKEFDTDGGVDGRMNLNYFGARYYEPELGVWISPDPARQFASPYSYSPNPINSVDPDGNEFDFDLKTEEGRQGLFAFTDCALNCAEANRSNMYALQDSKTVFHFGPLPDGLPSEVLGRFNPNIMTFQLSSAGFAPEAFLHEVQHAYDWDIIGMRWGRSAPISLEARGLNAGFLEVEKRGSSTLFPGLYGLWQTEDGRDYNKLGPDIPRYHPGYRSEIQKGTYYNDYKK